MTFAEIQTQWWQTVVNQAAKFDREENEHNRWLFETALESWHQVRTWSLANKVDYPPPPKPSPRVKRTVIPEGVFYRQEIAYGPGLVAEPYVEPPPLPEALSGVINIAEKREAGGFWANQGDTVAVGEMVVIKGKSHIRRVRETPFAKIGYYDPVD